MVLAVCGCNQVFGIHGAGLADAPYFDAPADAPFSCPPLDAELQFSPVVHQLLTQNCSNFTVSSSGDVAAATCVDDSIIVGPLAGPLVPVTLLPPTIFVRRMPRVSPEGDELWIHEADGTVLPPLINVYKQTGEHEWTQTRTVMRLTAADDAFTPPSRWDGGHRVFFNLSSQTRTLDEYSDDGMSVTLIRSLRPDELGVDYLLFPSVTADGLRLIASGGLPSSLATMTVYATRETIAQPLHHAIALSTAPVVLDPFLAADCGRLYTSGLGYEFYAQQR